MSAKEEDEAAKKELLPGKKNKSARFQVVATEGDDKKGEEDDGHPQPHQMTHQGSHHTHQGSHQLTMYAKSFRHYLTRDVLPSESNYRNLLSFSRHSAHKRPTMQELRDEEIMMNNTQEVRFGKLFDNFTFV